ncbi:MAG: ankyrin repeat domain-containing protein [Phycisphaeraceae bacterium]|nr:ankyrin repeat domain-containing protein [Phycisphaeraceae bacterium]
MTDTPFTPQELGQAFFNAQQRGDYGVMQEALESGAGPATARDVLTGRNILFAAIDRMDVVLTDSREFSSLSARLVQYIVDGANPNARDHAGVSPLNYALQKQNYMAASLLLGAGAAADEKFPDGGDTPLHVAVRLANDGHGTRLFSVLLAMGADPALPNDAGQSAFDIAAGDARTFLAATEKVQQSLAAHRDAHLQALRAGAKKLKL